MSQMKRYNIVIFEGDWMRKESPDGGYVRYEDAVVEIRQKDQRIATLKAGYKKSELMWSDEKGVLEDRIAELEADHKRRERTDEMNGHKPDCMCIWCFQSLRSERDKLRDVVNEYEDVRVEIEGSQAEIDSLATEFGKACDETESQAKRIAELEAEVKQLHIVANHAPDHLTTVDDSKHEQSANDVHDDARGGEK